MAALIQLVIPGQPKVNGTVKNVRKRKMSHRLDQTCNIPVGTRDAVHVPFVVGSPLRTKETPIQEVIEGFKPGSFVKFVDDKFINFVLCPKEEAHGILNPFLDKISFYDPVVVMLIPGITSPVVHHFNIDPKMMEFTQRMLEVELESAKEADPNCASCYEIRNNELIRN